MQLLNEGSQLHQLYPMEKTVNISEIKAF